MGQQRRSKASPGVTQRWPQLHALWHLQMAELGELNLLPLGSVGECVMLVETEHPPAGEM